MGQKTKSSVSKPTIARRSRTHIQQKQLARVKRRNDRLIAQYKNPHDIKTWHQLNLLVKAGVVSQDVKKGFKSPKTRAAQQEAVQKK